MKRRSRIQSEKIVKAKSKKSYSNNAIVTIDPEYSLRGNKASVPAWQVHLFSDCLPLSPEVHGLGFVDFKGPESRGLPDKQCNKVKANIVGSVVTEMHTYTLYDEFRPRGIR